MSEKLTAAQLMASPFTTGALKVNFSQNRVVFHDCELVLQPKVLELLVLLCAAQGETLSKQVLVDSLWPDTVVGPDSLANTMARLRKALNDDAKNPTFIATVQRKGYRWLQEVECAEKPEAKPELKQEPKNKRPLTTYLILAASVVCVGLIWLFLIKPAPEPQPATFPFPDLKIQKLPEGGYEIEVGIEGELTQERKAAMLKELKRITGEEHSGMEFTVDPVDPSYAKCDPAKGNAANNPKCQKSRPPV
ncbi:MAG: winged helix-turn-helix domain-containing protein [Algicola sp.]|nr:winged helix-turn-helix domain-containing protein [Algicola sp.]